MVWRQGQEPWRGYGVIVIFGGGREGEIKIEEGGGGGEGADGNGRGSRMIDGDESGG
jgi:hypothetical protein